MKKFLSIALALTMMAAISSCGQSSTASDSSAEAPAETTAAEEAAPTEDAEQTEDAEAGTEETETEEADASEESSEPTTVNPMPNDMDLANLTDCTVAASFDPSAINWRGGTITAEIYATYYYDTVDVNMMKVGDSINIGDMTVEVESISYQNDDIILNQGTGNEFCLRPEDGGVYEIIETDDMPITQDMGEVELTLSQDVTLSDQTDPSADAAEISADDFKAYVEELDSSYFNGSNTTIEITNGEVTHISRIWTP